MNILIVDDEKLEVEVIRRMIDVHKYGVDEIYCAYSLKQAVEVMELHDITVLLSDIEMPRGSGHELVEWIREQGLDTIPIFLTSHAVFSYAQEALRLGVIQYILKPVVKEELEAALNAAAEQVRLNEQIEQNRKYAERWNSSQQILRKEFWRRLLDSDMGRIPIDYAHMAQTYGLSLKEGERFFPILVAWERKHGKGSAWDDSTIEFALENVLSELLWESPGEKNLLNERHRILIFYRMDTQPEQVVTEKLELMLQQCRAILGFCRITCYVDQPVEISRIRKSAFALMQSEDNDVKKSGGVIRIHKLEQRPGQYQKPDMEKWIRELFEPGYRKVILQIESYLNTLGASGEADSHVLNCFQHDFLQELYGALKKRGIQANSILKNEKLVPLFNESSHSIEDMQVWIRELIEFLASYSYETEKTPNIVRKLETYIEENLQEELTRSDLAARVFLHPDYLSHIFKEKTGMSISDYIIHARLERAKVLLRSTEGRISEVSQQVGYTNTAYFTKLFKRATGMTPKEFRKEQESV